MPTFFQKLGLRLSVFAITLSIQTFSRAGEFNVGFNQAWFKQAYGSQWSDAQYDPQEVDRILDLNKKAGSKTLRMWLFEGQDSNALVWKDGKVAGLNPEFTKNLEKFLLQAKAKGIQVYPTLFDGNAFNDMPAGPMRDRWWNLMNNKYGGYEAFKKNALEPLFKLLNRPDLKPSIFGLDVTNEIDTVVGHNRFEKGWSSANELTCHIRESMIEAKGNGRAIPVTASVGWPWVPFVTRSAVDTLLEPNPYPGCVDFFDLHLYDNNGNIPNCEKLRALGQKYGKKLYLGEFGQGSSSYDDQQQHWSTEKFIQNAKNCGFSGALAWRLSDVRPASKKDARFSYDVDGHLRPGFETIRKFNEQESFHSGFIDESPGTKH